MRHSGGSGAAWPEIASALTNRNLIMLLVGVVVVLLPTSFSGAAWLESRAGVRPRLARVALITVLLPWVLVLAAAGTFSPFLYYQF